MLKKLMLFLLLILIMGCQSTEKKIVKKEIDLKRKLFITGDMNNWRKSIKLTENEKNIYTGKMILEPGSYRFRICNIDESIYLAGEKKDVFFIEEDKEFKQVIINKESLGMNIFYVKDRAKYILTLKSDNNFENIIFKIEKKDKNSTEGEFMLNWRGNKGNMKITKELSGLRSYKQSTTAVLRDETDQNREFSELEGQLIIRTGNTMFDGLFAMAIEEVRENSVEYINDYAFNNGKPLKYSAFETGEKWHYIWTRDLAYAVNLSLAHVDPKRAMNSLLFKVSEKREDGSENVKKGMEIVQDTGSGGSWPVSSDRVTWAFGAVEVLKYLEGNDYNEFFETSYEAIKNTIENDRFAVYDTEDGLYRGEQSFLDWREQTYPSWTAEDTVYIGMSKTLSTNAAHYSIIKTASIMSGKKGEIELSKKYLKWANDLKESINREFWLEDEGMYSTMKIKVGKDRTVKMYDMLGESLCIILGIADKEKAEKIIENYPNTEAGVPVIWPQLPDTAIYHNRGMWPFVSAYALKAAKIAENDKVINNNVMSLYRSSAINLSNMENYDVISGLHTFVDKYNSAGPVVNSKRQLWSVGGYLSMVIDTLFGLSVEEENLVINPFLTGYLYETLFKSNENIKLKNFVYKGKNINLEIVKPNKINKDSIYKLNKISLNGELIVGNKINFNKLENENNIVIDLLEKKSENKKIKLIKLKDYRTINDNEKREIFTPKELEILSIKQNEKDVEIKINLPKDENVLVNLYRNGEKIQEGLRTEKIIDKNILKTMGKDQEFSVEDGSLKSKDALIETKQGKTYFKLWGQKDETIQIENIKTEYNGEYNIRIVYANSHNSVNTGITSCNKYIEIKDKKTGEIVKSGVVFMPHLSSWRVWGESSIFAVQLKENGNYELAIKDYYNMSYFKHFSIYNNTGGKIAVNTANIEKIKLIAPSNYYSVEAEDKDSKNQSHQSKVK